MVRSRVTYAASRTMKVMVRTAARFDGASQDALQRDYCAWLPPPPDLGKMETKKPAAGLPARAKSFDDAPMPVICPSCQICFCGRPARIIAGK